MASIVGYKQRYFEWGSKGFDRSCYTSTCLAQASFVMIADDGHVAAYCTPHAAWYAMRNHVTRMPLSLQRQMRGDYDYYKKGAEDEPHRLRTG